eukprot:PITA_04575
MDTSIYDQLFVSRTMGDCTWANSNYGHFDISDYRVLEEGNGLRALMDSNFFTANSVLNCTEDTRSPNTELMRTQYGNDIFGGCTYNLSDQPYSCTWNAAYHRDFDDNSFGYGYYNSSKSFQTENREHRGTAFLSYGGEFEQNRFGASTAFNFENSNGLSKDQSLDQEKNLCEIFTDQGLQNELGLICGNVNDKQHVGSDSSKVSVGYFEENFMKNAIGQPYNGISFNQDDEMGMNGGLVGYNTESVISTLLNSDKTSIEPLELDGTKGIATVSVNELDGFDNKTPLSTSYGTEIYSDQKSPQTVGLPVKPSENREPITIGGSQLVKDDGNGEENGRRLDGLLFMNDTNHGTKATFTTGEGDSSNAKVVRGGGSKSKGHPAKNLLAERRRRKRLNERLCMLRSVVPTITKMDRTSILSDTIEHTKQLLQQIRLLHSELKPQDKWPVHLRAYEGYFRSAGMDCGQKFADKHISKFEVKRTGTRDVNIHMTCQTNPSILLNTISTLESFGLDIQQAIISCFSDFGMQAHCSEIEKAKSNIRPEDIKLALLQTAGYLG